MFRLFLDFICCIFILEKKNISQKIQYIFFVLKETNIFLYFKYLIFNKKINPIKSKSFNLYLKKNKKIWTKEKFKKNNNIIVENFINHPGYTLSNAIAAKYLSQIYNSDVISIIRKGDLKARALFNSYNFKKIIEINNPNFFFRIKCLILAFKIIPKSKSINEFCNLKFKKVEIGLSTYDSYIRFTRIPTLVKINNELIVMLSQAISSYFFINKTISGLSNVKYSIQSETVFNPSNIYFQICLLKKIDIFARCGENEISLRRYTDWSQRHQYRYNISNKLFNFIENNLTNNKRKFIEKFYLKKSKNIKYGFDTKIPLVKFSNLKLASKEDLLKKFNWTKNKKIIVFFLNVLIDRNFHNGPRINFRDNYTWTNFMLKNIEKIDNVNWIIKKHPINSLYNSSINFDKKIDELCKKKKHVKLFPKKYANGSLLNIADRIITSHGTAGIEYPAYGIESIFVEKSLYSNMSFMNMVKNKKELLMKLNNLNTKKINISTLKKKSLTFLFIQDFILKNKCSLLPVYLISRNINFENFWLESLKKLHHSNIKKDKFFEMLKIQLVNNMRHTCDFKKMNLNPKKMNDCSN